LAKANIDIIHFNEWAIHLKGKNANPIYKLPPFSKGGFELPPALAGEKQIHFPFIGFSQILSYLFG